MNHIEKLEHENKQLKLLLGDCCKSMRWMITVLKHQYDTQTFHDPRSGPNQYSPELTKADNLLVLLNGTQTFYPHYCKACYYAWIASEKREPCPVCKQDNEIVTCFDHMEKQNVKAKRP